MNRLRDPLSNLNLHFLSFSGSPLALDDVTICDVIRKVEIYPGSTSTPDLLRSPIDIGSWIAILNGGNVLLSDI